MKVVPRYWKLDTFSKGLSVILTSWICPAFWSRDMKVYLVPPAFTPIPAPLLTTNKTLFLLRVFVNSFRSPSSTWAERSLRRAFKFPFNSFLVSFSYWHILGYWHNLNMDGVYFSEMSVNFHQIIRHHIDEHRNLHCHLGDNFKSRSTKCGALKQRTTTISKVTEIYMYIKRKP
jgi:hypothetical protein